MYEKSTITHVTEKGGVEFNALRIFIAENLDLSCHSGVRTL